jgi:hypothetical protein
LAKRDNRVIAGKQIAEELSKLIGSGVYDPAVHPCSRRLPQTMRQLIEGDFDIEDTNIASDSLRPQINLKAGLCRRNVFAPIMARQLSIKRPTPPAIKGKDCRGYYVLVSSFYQWLKSKKKAGGINIDHDLEDKTWPLWKRFEQEIKERTGFEMYDFFGYHMNQQEDCPDEPPQWDCAWMPLYEIEWEEDAAPLLEFLSGMQEDFPEAVYDDRDAEQIHEAWEIMEKIIKSNKTNLLPDDWALAFTTLKKYHWGIVAYDPEEMKFPIENAEDIENFFKAAQEVAEMIKGTLPLVKKCRANSGNFWDDLIEHLLRLPVRKKRKLKPQNLIQVLNEEKIQVRV